MAEQYNIPKSEYEKLSKRYAISLVGIMCKRLELLGDLDTSDKNKALLYKALVKELIYENARDRDFAVKCLANNLTKVI